MNQVDVVIYSATGVNVTNLESSTDILNFNFLLNDQNGDYSYLHNKTTNLIFDNFTVVGTNDGISTTDGLVVFEW